MQRGESDAVALSSGNGVAVFSLEDAEEGLLRESMDLAVVAHEVVPRSGAHGLIVPRRVDASQVGGTPLARRVLGLSMNENDRPLRTAELIAESRRLRAEVRKNLTALRETLAQSKELSMKARRLLAVKTRPITRST